MPAASASGKSKRRTTSAGRARPRSSARRTGRWLRLPLMLWEQLPLLLTLLVFVAAFTFDPEAVTRLVWACVSGTFGTPVQIAGAAILLSVVAATLWAFRPLPSYVRGQQKSVRRPATRTTSVKDASASDAKQREDADAPKRRTRNRSTSETAPAPEAREHLLRPSNSSAISRTQSNMAGEEKKTRSKTPRDSSSNTSPKRG